MKTFQDKVCVVTGAASGIGRASALAFAREGADVVVSDVNERGLGDVARAVEALGRKALAVRCDVSKAAEVEALAKEAIAWKGGVDLLMNNAGVAVGGHAEDVSLEDWNWILDVNVKGVVHGVHYFLPHMLERGSGHIVNMASLAGLAALVGMAPYCATKFAVVGFSECLRAETAARGVDVTAVCPGFVRTEIARNARIAGKGEFDRGWIDRARADPDALARRIVRAVRRNEAVCLFTPAAHLLTRLKRFFPGLYDAATRSLGPRVDEMYREGKFPPGLL